jgi:hypothetical protein
MNPGVSRPGRLGLLVYRARGSENMFICLESGWISGSILKDQPDDPQKQGVHSEGVRSRGLLYHTHNLHKETLAIGHQRPGFGH